MSDLEIFDRPLLASRRERAAARAVDHDFLLHRVAEDFAERLGAVRRQFPIVADLGAHHGIVGGRVKALPGVSMVVSVDRSWKLLAQCGAPRVSITVRPCDRACDVKSLTRSPRTATST